MSSKSSQISIGILAVVLLGAILYWGSSNSEDKESLEQKVVSQHDVMVVNYITKLHIATSTHDREVGLSKFNSIAPDEAMLFVFEKAGFYYIWMKDMKFSIDILFFDTNFKVISFEENISPDSFPKSFSSPSPSAYILETHAGFVKEKGIKVGQTFIFDQKTVHNSNKI